MSEHQSRNTSPAHLEAFYQPFREARERRFDGLIITGAPIEHLDFEAVSYWNELREVFDWTQTHVHATMGVCWGGMAMLHHFHGIPKHMLPAKAFGCFTHRPIVPAAPLLQGFSDSFVVPVSRWTEVRDDDVELHPELQVLIHSEDVGPCLIEDRGHRAHYMFNHLEYDLTTLQGGIRARPAHRRPDRSAGRLFPRRRPEPAAGEPLAQPRPAALRQLDQPRSTRPRPSRSKRSADEARRPPMTVVTTGLLYLAAAIAEIAGCFAVWAWLREGRSAWWLAPGAVALLAFAWLLARSPADHAGRAFAAYGGVYIAASLGWMWLVEGQRPDRWDLGGGGLALFAAALILFAPRG